MTLNKVLAVTSFAFLVTGISVAQASQQQIEGAAPAVMAPAGVEHQHQLPNGTFITHTHKNGGDTSHTHTMAEVKKALHMK
ncbi:MULTISPECIES: hypothetical protein [unclassified Cocleimonas]|uniref:hypothetical protein n=1 Tax=unclassified Cocleimonas TaxID=2639732 RepID=UPI00260F8B2D|nr:MULTISPECIES: hypothetical protein [unclassified Cocleimonas]MEB8433592.1 hypothetical protein [Cocleimonas sp. KMM 6892]MEC4716403.1 hypothetical protein [Cocleimonas sp. KMM 6895]MEC4745704.1 hypothetical protein [Cocleimonas sp. KMM 6896]